MGWYIVGIGAAGLLGLLVVVAVVLTIVRFNQLSMARSLCDEAKRQLLVELRARHALVPPFIGALQQMNSADHSVIELALASAQRAPFGPRGAAAENALSARIDAGHSLSQALSDLNQDPRTQRSVSREIRDELETTVELLHGQLTVIGERILSGARIYNTNVLRYHRQRGRLLSRPFSHVFLSRELFAETTGEGSARAADGEAASSSASAAHPREPAKPAAGPVTAGRDGHLGEERA